MSFHLSFHFLASFISRTLGYQVMFRLKLLTWWSVAGRGSQAGEGLTQPGSWDCHNRPVLPMTWPWQRNYLLWTNCIFMTKQNVSLALFQHLPPLSGHFGDKLIFGGLFLVAHLAKFRGTVPSNTVPLLFSCSNLSCLLIFATMRKL